MMADVIIVESSREPATLPATWGVVDVGSSTTIKRPLIKIKK